MAEDKVSEEELLTLVGARFINDWDGTVLVPHLESIYDGGAMHAVDHLLSLDTDTAFGNLTLSWLAILLRVGAINNTLDSINRDFALLDPSWQSTNPSVPLSLATQYEALVYLLKTTADHVVMLLSLVDTKHKLKSYPDKVPVGSIGALTKLGFDTFCDGTFLASEPMLTTLNTVANSYKHSFLNLQATNIVMKNTPGVITFCTPYNDTQSGSYLAYLVFVNTIREFDTFLETAKAFVVDNRDIAT